MSEVQITYYLERQKIMFIFILRNFWNHLEKFPVWLTFNTILYIWTTENVFDLIHYSLPSTCIAAAAPAWGYHVRNKWYAFEMANAMNVAHLSVEIHTSNNLSLWCSQCERATHTCNKQMFISKSSSRFVEIYTFIKWCPRFVQ